MLRSTIQQIKFVLNPQIKPIKSQYQVKLQRGSGAMNHQPSKEPEYLSTLTDVYTGAHLGERGGERDFGALPSRSVHSMAEGTGGAYDP